jgi:hypothetical protein
MSGSGTTTLAVEASRAQQGRVEHVRPVGCRNNDDTHTGLEPVHFDQQLIQGLFAFVVSAAKAGTALAPRRHRFHR